MTITIAPASPTTPIVASGTTWTAVSDGLWAGSRAGEFLGTIEFVDGGFSVADPRGIDLGRAHSLAEAQRLADDPAAVEPERVLLWNDERRVLVLGWIALAASAAATVGIAAQFFV